MSNIVAVAFAKPNLAQITGISMVEMETLSEKDLTDLLIQAQASVQLLTLALQCKRGRAGNTPADHGKSGRPLP